MTHDRLRTYKPNLANKIRFYSVRYLDMEASVDAYAAHMESELERFAHKAGGRGLAAVLLEPFFGVPGLYMPPKEYMERLFRCAREKGAIIIVDEVTTGLGRTGENFWSFQHYGVVPDIVVVSQLRFTR